MSHSQATLQAFMSLDTRGPMQLETVLRSPYLKATKRVTNE